MTRRLALGLAIMGIVGPKLLFGPTQDAGPRPAPPFLPTVPLARKVIYVVGDSITAGGVLPSPATEGFGVRLQARTGVLTINKAQNGQCALNGGCYHPTTMREEWEGHLTAWPKPTTILFAGFRNDLGGAATTAQLAAALLGMVEEANAAGIQVVVATIIPPTQFWLNAGGADPYPPRQATELQRLELNGWIRTLSRVVDFDVALRDPFTLRLRPQYDSGDGLHPNALGTDRMALEVAGHMELIA